MVHTARHHPPPPSTPADWITAVGAFGLGLALAHLHDQRRIRFLRGQLRLARYEARHDPLTGLGNRRVVNDALDQGWPALVGLCDINGLKTVNDRFGHDTGDELLRVAADRLTAAMTGRGLAARLGGDEFALLWADHPDDPLTDAHDVLTQLTQPVALAGEQIEPRVSLGLAIATPRTHGRGLLSAADAAMYQAKHTHTPVRIHEHSIHENDADADADPGHRPLTRRRDHPDASAPS